MNSLLRNLGFLAAAALACFYVIVLLRGPQGIPAMLHIRQEVLEMEDGNRKLREEVERKKQYIKKLESDPAVRDREVRSGTNKQQPDETTIFLSEEPAPASAAPPR